MTGRLQSIPLDVIQTDPRLQNRNVGMQKYKEHSDAKRYKDHINQLTRSIRAQGQLEPLRVIAAEEDGRYELAPGADRPHFIPVRYWLVDGHHRLEALRKARQESAQAEVLSGLGFDCALIASRLANQQVVQSLSAIERTENAWSAFNLPSDHFRRMGVEEAARVLSVSPATIKRFRDAVRQEGARTGKVDPDASRDKIEQQLQAYWNRKSTWSRFSIITWRQFQDARKEPSKRTSLAAQVRMIQIAIAQTVYGEDGRYDDPAISRALAVMGREAERPDADTFLRNKYKPKVSQPAAAQYEEGDECDHIQLGLEVAKMREAQAQARNAS
jgi:ParB-like chromosome segregation protein Spo0J